MAHVLVLPSRSPEGGKRRASAAALAFHAALLLLLLALRGAAPEIETWSAVEIPAPPPDPAPPQALSGAPSASLPSLPALPRTAAAAPALPHLPAVAHVAPAMPAVADRGRAESAALPAAARDLGTAPRTSALPSMPGTNPSAPSHASLPRLVDRGRTQSSLPLAVRDRGISPRTAALPTAPPRRHAAASSPHGIRMEGPLSGRGLASYRLPEYPEWARRQGVRAFVSIRCEVAAEGAVSEVMVVEVSSGHEELDDRAMAALRGFRFTPIPGSSVQWGVVTFEYKLE